jgi:2-polyprenyl-6-methoxyphenol hydroxylase-like FAD-dependent oxidoreductase
LVRSDELLSRANSRLAANLPARVYLQESARLRNRVWGTRQRGIVLDESCLGFLRSNDVDTASFPILDQMRIDWGADAPELLMQYGERGHTGESSLSANGLILERDWAAQPSICELERAIRCALESYPNVIILFDSSVDQVRDVDECVEVTVGTEIFCPRMLVIADGGGSKSLVSQVNSVRRVVGREHLDVAVFATQSDWPAPIAPSGSGQVWGNGFVTPQGWTGVGDNGRIVTVDVRSNVASQRLGVPAKTAYEVARELGVHTRLVEPPMRGSYSLDRVERFTIGAHILLAGDAAVRGSPLFALGAQYALLWAQFAGRCVQRCLAGDESAALIEYEGDADHAATVRLDFETACVAVLDQANGRRRSFAQALSSPGMLSSARILHCSFGGTPSGGLLKLEMQFDFPAMAASYASPELAALKWLGVAQLLLNCRVNITGDSLRIDMSRDDVIIMRTKTEKLRLANGTIVFCRKDGQWQLDVLDVQVRRRRGGTDRVTPLRRMCVRLPDSFLDATLRTLPETVVSDRPSQPLAVRFTPAEGAVWEWGPLTVCFRKAPVVGICLQVSPTQTRLRLDLHHGHIELMSLSNLADNLPVGVLRPIGQMRHLFNGAFDDLFDALGGIASTAIKGLVVDIEAKGKCRVHCILRYTDIALPLPLTDTDSKRLLDEFLSVRILGNALQSSATMHRFVTT